MSFMTTLQLTTVLRQLSNLSFSSYPFLTVDTIQPLFKKFLWSWWDSNPRAYKIRDKLQQTTIVPGMGVEPTRAFCSTDFHTTTAFTANFIIVCSLDFISTIPFRFRPLLLSLYTFKTINS